jgi:transposase-like protein
MAYSKLTPAVIEPLICELRDATQTRVACLSAGLSIRWSSVRSICEKAGISHTTFYRWLRAYGSLKHRKGRLTASEKLLGKFGRAVEAYLAVDAGVKEVGAQTLETLKASRRLRRGKASVSPPPEEHPDLSAFEARTDELVGNFGNVTAFDMPKLSLKNK